MVTMRRGRSCPSQLGIVRVAHGYRHAFQALALNTLRLTSLIADCEENNEMMLVYEYKSN
mgnify:FL=1